MPTNDELVRIVTEAITEHEQRSGLHLSARDRATLQALADIVVGPEITDVDGTVTRAAQLGLDMRLANVEKAVSAVRDEVGDARAELAALKQQLQNGLRVRLPWTVWVAIIGAAGTVLAALVGRL